MGATIKDIAKKLNISVSTVSYALNDGPRPVPPEVKERVLKTAEELDYRPNRLARSLVTRKNETVGIVFDRTIPDLVLSPFRQVILNAILNTLESVKYDALLITGAEENGQPKVSRLLDGRVDGIVILSPLVSDHVIQALEVRSFPYVTIAAGDDRSGADFSVDNRHGIEIGFEHLYELGHRKIGFVYGLPDHRDSIEREAAFRDSAKARGLKIPEEWIRYGDFTEIGGAAAAAQIVSLSNRPTALMFANDESARGGIRAVQKKGLKVPDDLSVVGFDDLYIAAECEPPLTSIRQPLDQIGTEAVLNLLQVIDGASAVSRQFEAKLILRRSTAPPCCP